MKSLILVTLILSLYGLPASADRSPPSPDDGPNPSDLKRAATRASGPAAVPSKSGWNINVVDALEVGNQYSVHIAGDIAYIGYTGLLAVLDIADLAAPRKIGYTFLAGTCYRIDQSGDYLYCVIVDRYDNDDLVIVDISDRANPLVLQKLPIQGRDIDVDGNYLYVEHGNGLRVFDISNPTSPVLLGFCSSYYITDIEAQNGYVYVARGVAGLTGLQIVDATDPANPTQTALLPVSGGAYHLDVWGTYVYVITFYAPDSFCVIDVANPSAPVIVSTILGTDFVDVAVKGQYAFVGDYYGFLHVFDVGNPANPVALPPLETPCDSEYVTSMDVSGNVAALGVEYYGICFVDLSVPGNPLDLAAHEALPWAHTLDVSGSRLAVSLNYGQMAWVDRYDPTIRTIVDGHSGAIDGSDVVVRGDYAYMTMDDSNYNTYDGLEIFDISDPANVVSVGHMDTPWFPGPLSVGASHVYIAPSGAMWVIDVSNPSVPTKVGGLSIGVGGLFADEPYLYALTSGYLRVIDVANPSSPSIVASLPLSGATWDLWLAGSIVYVASGEALHMVDVSNPLQPFLLGSFPTTTAYSVRVRDQYAYVSAGDYLRIVDVSDPSEAVEVGNIETPFLWSRVVVAPPYVYAVTDYDPLLILETPLMTAVSREQGSDFLLGQNYPNPFNPSTTIAFEIPSRAHVQIDIFDVRGSLVRTLVKETMPAGPHSVTWDGRDSIGNPARSGVYFCRLTAGGRTESKKMMILK